ncbi:MAG TPA: hypothetical protein GXX18_12480, partial [Bacillales bacterium]|nr:hypothetical protein [Bacillales bacterium]
LHMQMDWRLREAQSEGICITQLEVQQLDKIYVEEQKKFYDQMAMLTGMVDPSKKAKVSKNVFCK